MENNEEPDMDDYKKDKGRETAEREVPPPAEPFLPCEPGKSDEELKHLLPPDHPLLQRFQQSLKEHLLRIKNQLSEDIAVIKHNIKLKEEEREEYGVKLYDMQHEIEKQNSVLEEYSQNISETVSKRIESEELQQSLKMEYDEKFALTKEHKFQYNQRLVELDHLQNLENNLRNWTDEFETELNTSKRVVSRDVQLQKSIAEEKQQADLMSYNLQVEVKKRDEELSGLKQQIVEQQDLNNVLHSSLADANADLEALQVEHKRLTQAWGEVIVAIGHRDKVLFQAKQSLENQIESLKLTHASIEGTMKQTSKETENNTKLLAFKARLESDLVMLKRDTEKQSKILAKLDMKMEELPKLIDRTEKDYQEAKKESNQLLAQINTIQFKLEKQDAIKGRIEDSILKIAQDQLMCDKASEYRVKVLTDHQAGRRTMESNLHKVEIQLAAMLMKLEQQKTVNQQLREEGNSLAANLKELSDEVNGLNDEMKRLDVQVSIKLKLIDRLSKELDELVKEAQGCEVSPTEYKMQTLQKAIQETDQKIQSHQQFWLILQGHIVHLSQKRNAQLNDIQVAQKQLMIISQKSLKIDMDIEKTDNSSNEINREIDIFATKLELLSAKVYEKRKQHENNAFDCELEHFVLLNKLKDSEMKVLQLEQETIDLSNDIETHKQLVLEHHREALSWETKYKLLDETLRWRRNETAIESEIGNMKAEIHRMQIRHKELKRAQEKLIQDLDHCVMHRERIFVLASTKQKMEGVHFRSRTNIQQRINDVQTKLKQVHCEINGCEKKLCELNKELFELEEARVEAQKAIDEEIYQEKLLTEELEQAILLKHQNLDCIVRKQTRAKEYRRLAASKTQPRTSRSETSIDNNIQRQAEINHHLLEVAECLLNEFPEKKFVLMRLIQALKAD